MHKRETRSLLALLQVALKRHAEVFTGSAAFCARMFAHLLPLLTCAGLRFVPPLDLDLAFGISAPVHTLFFPTRARSNRPSLTRSASYRPPQRESHGLDRVDALSTRRAALERERP